MVEENGRFGSAGEGGEIVSDIISEKGWLHINHQLILNSAHF